MKLFKRIPRVGDLVQLDTSQYEYLDQDGRTCLSPPKCSPFHEFIHIKTPGQLHVHKNHIARVVKRNYIK